LSAIWRPLQAKLDKQGGKPEAANATKKKAKRKKDFCRSEKTVTTNSVPKKRTGAGGLGDAISSTAKGSAKGRSKSKVGGNKQATNTKKRS
jgi:hypothetical protein